MKKTIYLLICSLFAGLMLGCNSPEGPTTLLKNDCLHRSWGIHMVGEELVFAYAAAMPYDSGKIESMKVTASIAGGPSTRFDTRAYKTSQAGVEVGTTVATNIPQTNPCSSKVDLIVDTCAITLRYYYEIPEEARDKDVTFTFYASADNGEVVSYEMGPIHCSRQDCKTGLEASNERCYISIEDMAVYTYDEVVAGNKSVDIIYTYKTVKTPTSPSGSSSIGGLNKCFMAPTTEAINRIEELKTIQLPPVERNTKLRESAHAKDEVIEQSKWHLYITDEDFAALDFRPSPVGMGYSNLVTNFVTEYNCIWIESEDGRYRAWMWVNTPSSDLTDQITFGMKRYEVK